MSAFTNSCFYTIDSAVRKVLFCDFNRIYLFYTIFRFKKNRLKQKDYIKEKQIISQKGKRGKRNEKKEWKKVKKERGQEKGRIGNGKNERLKDLNKK